MGQFDFLKDLLSEFEADYNDPKCEKDAVVEKYICKANELIDFAEENYILT